MRSGHKVLVEVNYSPLIVDTTWVLMLSAQDSTYTHIDLVLLLFFIGQLSVPGMVRPIH
jgi:hypothetical protein